MNQTQVRKALLEALYEAYNRRDVPAMLSGLAPDAEWLDMLKGEPVKGREAVGDYWTQQFKQMDFEVTPLTIDALPDGRLVVTAAQTMKRPDGTLWGNDRVTHVFTFSPEGLIRRMDPS